MPPERLPRDLPRDLRRAPRVDVLMRVKGELVQLDVPFTVFNLSSTGFAVKSEIRFDVGAPLNFRLIGADGLKVLVTAEAVHRRPIPTAPGQYLTGFKFIPGHLLGRVPQALIDRLIEAIVPVGALI